MTCLYTFNILSLSDLQWNCKFEIRVTLYLLKSLMNRILIFLFCMILSGQCFSQEITDYWSLPHNPPKQVVIDKSKVEVIYEHLAIDPVLDTFDPDNCLILQTGDFYSKFWEYEYFRSDSALAAYGHEKLDRRMAHNIHKQYEHSHRYRYPKFIIKDYKKNKIKEKYYVSGFYVFSEDTPTISWELTEEMDSICGYPCIKAHADFCGRKWDAWFTNDIPLSDGPFRFQGLPGLILKMESEDKEHRLTAISIRNGHNDIYEEKTDDYKTTRERCRKLYENFHLNPAGTIDISNIKQADGSDPRSHMQTRLFYNPIELE